MREQSNTTLKTLSESTNLSKGNLSSYENNKFKPSADAIVLISNFFGISTDWLLTGKEFSSLIQYSPIGTEEYELIKIYSSCPQNKKNEIVEYIHKYLSDSNYLFKKNINEFSDDEINIISLYRQLNSRDRIKIEGIIESKIVDENKKETSSIYQKEDISCANDKLHA